MVAGGNRRSRTRSDLLLRIDGCAVTARLGLPGYSMQYSVPARGAVSGRCAKWLGCRPEVAVTRTDESGHVCGFGASRSASPSPNLALPDYSR